MTGDLDAGLRFVLRWEGGLSDNANNRGGRTMKGVTQRVYDAWRATNGHTQGADVAGITDAELAAIYTEGYWKKAGCDRAPAHLDLVQFDAAVNMGLNRAVKILQEAVGVAPDGDFGFQTQRACDGCSPPDAAARHCTIREALYHRFAQAPGQDRFLRGWLNRLNDLRVEAGVPGPARRRGGGTDFGDTDRIERLPDLRPGEPLEAWR